MRGMLESSHLALYINWTSTSVRPSMKKGILAWICLRLLLSGAVEGLDKGEILLEVDPSLAVSCTSEVLCDREIDGERVFSLSLFQSLEPCTGRLRLMSSGLTDLAGLRSKGLGLALRTLASFSHVSAISDCIYKI